MLGVWIAGARSGSCDTQLLEVSTDQVEQAVVAALPVAATGSGTVNFHLDLTGLHVHADSAFKDQTFDTTIPAVMHGSPMTLSISARVLSTMVSH